MYLYLFRITEIDISGKIILMSRHFISIAFYHAVDILFRPTYRWTVKYVHINGKVCTHKVPSNVSLDERDI